MYFIIVSCIISIIIFGVANFLDKGNRKKADTKIDASTLEKGEVNIEIFDTNANEDLKELEKSLGKSFLNDPAYSWIFPNEKTKLNGIGWLKIRMVALNFPFSNTLIATATVNGKRKIVGVSAWVPPGHKTGTADNIRAGLLKVPFLWGWFTFAKILAAADSSSSAKKNIVNNQSFWALDHLHVDPAFQGKGVARKLLEPVLKRIDTDKLPCILSAGNPKNLSLYEKFGFKVAKEVKDISYNGPPLWFMVRKPKDQ